MLGCTRPMKSLCAFQVKSLEARLEEAQQFSSELMAVLTWLQTEQVRAV